MIKVCLYVLFPSSTSLTYIALHPLGVFDLSLTSLTSSTYIALQPLGVFDVSLTSSTSSTYIALHPLGVFDLSSTPFDIALISCINLSQRLQHQTICIDMRPLMYTQQIR